MADKLKKSKTKPRSQRSIEEEQRREEAIRKHEEEMEKSKTARRSTLSTIFCWYALVSSIFSVFLGFWGIFSLMAIGFGIAGLKMNGNRRNKDFYAAWAGMILGAIWLVVQIVVAIQRMG